MVTVTVLRPFYDLVERSYRHEGDTFETSDERGKEIAERIPESVKVTKKRAKRASKTEE